jgi:carbon storage regulator
MLVLKRKQAESIVLEGGIRITILRIRGNAISLGIEAPEDVGIWRGELDLAGPEDDQPKPERSCGLALTSL